MSTRMSPWILGALLSISCLHGQSIEDLRKRDAKNVQVRAEPSGIDADGKQSIVLKLQIKPDWYIYAHHVELDLLDDSRTIIQVTGPDVLEARIDYPKGMAMAFLNERFFIYQGEVSIPIHVRRDSKMRRPIIIGASFKPECPSLGRCGHPCRVTLEVP